MKPPLIDFKLDTDEETRLFLIHDIQPPIWFYLTSGHYWINVGNDQLYRYSDAFAEKRKAEKPYVYHEIQEFWDDFLYHLPSMLDPIPDSIMKKIQPREPAVIWYNKVTDYYFDKIDDVNEFIVDWIYDRSYVNSPFASSGELHVWSNGKIVNLSCDNTFHEEKIFDTWAKVQGSLQITVEEFIDELRSFNQRFMTAVRHKIDFVRENELFSQSELEEVETAYDQSSQELERVLREGIPYTRYNWRDVEKMLDLIPIENREPVLSKAEIQALPAAEFQHKALLIRVDKTAPYMRLYDATNYAWKVNKTHAEQAEVVLACEHGQIIGVFIPERWLEATEENFPRRFAESALYGFEGHQAPESIQKLYIGKRIPDEVTFGRGNPIRYTWK